MDFPDLQALLSVHQNGSLQAAARNTGVSRTTLRRRLERLEAALGKPVHVVGAEGVRLTAAGRTLVDEGQRLLDARETLLTQARGARSPGNTFRILTQLGNPPRLNAMAAVALSELLPGVHIHADFDAQPLERLGDGFDAIVHWGDAPPLGDGFTKVLLRLQTVPMASSDYLRRHGTPETPADLADHTLLHLSPAEPLWPLVAGGQVRVEPRYTCTDLYMLGCLAGEGLGIALIPAAGLAVDPTVQALVPVLADHIRGEGILRISMPIPSSPDSAAAALIAVLSGMTDEIMSLQPDLSTDTGGAP